MDINAQIEIMHCYVEQDGVWMVGNMKPFFDWFVSLPLTYG